MGVWRSLLLGSDLTVDVFKVTRANLEKRDTGTDTGDRADCRIWWYDGTENCPYKNRTKAQKKCTGSAAIRKNKYEDQTKSIFDFFLFFQLYIGDFHTYIRLADLWEQLSYDFGCKCTIRYLWGHFPVESLWCRA